MGLPQLTDEDVEAARILMSFRRAPKSGTELPAAARPSLLSPPPSVAVWGGDGDDDGAGSSGVVEDAEFRLGYTHRQSYLDEAQGKERETEVQHTARFGITPEGKACLVFA